MSKQCAYCKRASTFRCLGCNIDVCISHVFSLLDAEYKDLPLDLIEKLMMELPLDDLAKLAVQNNASYRVYKDASFRRRYIEKHGQKKVSKQLMRILDRKQLRIFVDWFGFMLDEQLISGTPMDDAFELFGQNGDIETAKLLLSHVKGIHGRFMVLHGAIKNNNVELARYIILSEKVDPAGRTALLFFLAVQNGRLEILKFMLKHGDVTMYYKQLAVQAIKYDRFTIFKFLLDLVKKADGGIIPGRAFLREAIRFGRLDVVKLLIETEVDFPIRIYIEDLLQLAKESNRPEIYDYLEDRSADFLHKE